VAPFSNVLLRFALAFLFLFLRKFLKQKEQHSNNVFFGGILLTGLDGAAPFFVFFFGFVCFLFFFFFFFLLGVFF